MTSSSDYVKELWDISSPIQASAILLSGVLRFGTCANIDSAAQDLRVRRVSIPVCPIIVFTRAILSPWDKTGCEVAVVAVCWKPYHDLQRALIW